MKNSSSCKQNIHIFKSPTNYVSSLSDDNVFARCSLSTRHVHDSCVSNTIASAKSASSTNYPPASAATEEHFGCATSATTLQSSTYGTSSRWKTSLLHASIVADSPANPAASQTLRWNSRSSCTLPPHSMGLCSLPWLSGTTHLAFSLHYL